MVGLGNPFSQNNPTSDNFESSFCPDPNTQENRERLFAVDNQVIDYLRRHTRAYVKKIGGLPIIPDFPRREYKRRDRPILEDSVLVGDLEELVETSLQEVVQPLNQVGPETPYGSLVRTPVHSPPPSPPRIMVGINANQPPNPPNPPPAWKARSPLNLTPPLYDLPQDFEKMLPKFDPNEKILVDDHLQIFIWQ